MYSLINKKVEEVDTKVLVGKTVESVKEKRNFAADPPSYFEITFTDGSVLAIQADSWYDRMYAAVEQEIDILFEEGVDDAEI